MSNVRIIFAGAPSDFFIDRETLAEFFERLKEPFAAGDEDNVDFIEIYGTGNFEKDLADYAEKSVYFKEDLYVFLFVDNKNTSVNSIRSKFSTLQKRAAGALGLKTPTSYAYVINTEFDSFDDVADSFYDCLHNLISPYMRALQSGSAVHCNAIYTAVVDMVSGRGPAYEAYTESCSNINEALKILLKLHCDLNMAGECLFGNPDDATVKEVKEKVKMVSARIPDLAAMCDSAKKEPAGSTNRQLADALASEVVSVKMLIFSVNTLTSGDGPFGSMFGGVDYDDEDFEEDDDDYDEDEEGVTRHYRLDDDDDDYDEDEEEVVKSRLDDDDEDYDEEEEEEPVTLDEVQFSAISPKKISRGETAIINIVMYEEMFRSEVDEELAADEGVKETRSGIFNVEKNTAVRIVLSSPDIQIDNAEEELVWCGKYQKFYFDFTVPEDFSKKRILFRAQVYFNDVIATRLVFTVDCQSGATDTFTRSDVHSAFISYARKDIDMVTLVIQGLKKVRPDLNIFFDVESLSSGTDWETQIGREIDQRDVLFLFWSQNAKNSQWVEKEWRYALDKKGLDAIEPIPLQDPQLCPPPDELNAKHFNDKLIFFRK